MKVVGLTGPSGAGKSCCAPLFEELGFPVIDADMVYHGLIDSYSPCVEELVDAFGYGILDRNKAIDRKALGRIVFSDESRTLVRRLNQITHKFVKEETLRLLEEYRKNDCRAAIIDAPLLFEADFDDFCDFCVAVLAPVSLRLERIMERDSITEEQAKARIAAQQPDEYYSERARYTVVNDASVEDMTARIREILSKEGLLPQKEIK